MGYLSGIFIVIIRIVYRNDIITETMRKNAHSRLYVFLAELNLI